MSKRKILTLALSICMVAILAIGGSLAYLTDTDNDINTFTVGNVQIKQYEKDNKGNPYTTETNKIFPIVDDGKDENGSHTGKNYVHKIVTVENTGTEAAYIRNFVAIPTVLDNGPETYNAALNILHWNAASANDEFALANSGEINNDWWWGKNHSIDYPSTNDPWHGYQMTLNGVKYNVYIATHKTAVEPGKTTSPTLYGVYFDKTLDYGDITPDDGIDNPTYFVVQNGEKVGFDMPTKTITNEDGTTTTQPNTWDVLVFSQAVQAEGFGTDAYDALAHAFGDPIVEAGGEIPVFTCPFGGTDIKAF